MTIVLRDDVWMSCQQAARLLGLSAQRVSDLADAGELLAVRTSLGRLIEAGSVEALKQRREGGAEPAG